MESIVCWRADVSWNSDTLATWYEELTHWKRPWCWERLKAREGDDRGWDDCMASPTRWTCLSKLWDLELYREAWRAAVHGVAKRSTQLNDWTAAELIKWNIMSIKSVVLKNLTAVDTVWSHLLPGKSHAQRSLAGYCPWGHKRIGHNLVTRQQQQCWIKKQSPKSTSSMISSVQMSRTCKTKPLFRGTNT